MGLNNDSYKSNLIAHYKFDDPSNIGKDSSVNGKDAVASGTTLPTIKEIKGKSAASFVGGMGGTSFLQLPSDLLKDVSDNAGLTVSTWVYFEKGASTWERIFDFGKGQMGPYLFATRGLRTVCFAGADLAADPGKTYPNGEWIHIAISITGTKGGTLSSAGPIVYVNGDIAADGSISQTTSGNYGKFREWFSKFNDNDNFVNNYIGRSQFSVDPDFTGALNDFRIYNEPLSQDNVIEIMCKSLTDKDIVTLACDKYLSFPTTVINSDITLPTTLMGGKVKVDWVSSNQDAISNDGKVNNINTPQAVTFTATLTKDNEKVSKSYKASVLPKNLPPYVLTIEGDKEVLDISETLYGLFYEDINNAADGGIYADLIRNRSFEAFNFDVYDHRSGENAVSTGRNRKPFEGWYGDLDKFVVNKTGGLNEFFGIDDIDNNSHYITSSKGAVLINRGYNDTNNNCALFTKENAKYDFTVWAKSETDSSFTIELKDSNGESNSEKLTISVKGGNTWAKYGVDEKITLTAKKTTLGQVEFVFDGITSVDMLSLYPQDVWGANEEPSSASAHSNYSCNPNYRLRKDLVEALVDLHPTFLRFPGGCISEGSYIWDNVYDWKDSVGPIETRKENFNVWGYMMTMGLGYMEYFQLSEDLNATPLPVMACGVLCQARSDYANPAGGALQDKYISNFIDLIDFAISTDFENNEWAKLRKEMGHEKPFDLHYLGVGNENWGPEFMASFEEFYYRIRKHLDETYPGYPMYIISTVGAQADDDAFKYGWKFLYGKTTGTATVAFTDGKESVEKEVTWYEHQKDYMETIADEHYYRPNNYLLNNCDRYNYYFRAYDEAGNVDDDKISKVFVGEYASSDKNTLAGAVAEAAIMTHFENNSDVVRLVATAPLFNKVLTDGTYRWTPDCIWFDDETVWHTPTYYVQQLFSKYIGKKLLKTNFKSYVDGACTPLIPRGGIELATRDAKIAIKSVEVISNIDNSVLLKEDFTKGVNNSKWQLIPNSQEYTIDSTLGLILPESNGSLNGIYMIDTSWTNYKVVVEAVKLSGKEGFIVGAGLTEINPELKNVIEYSIALNGDTTGVKVYKNGVEGYTLGDFSSSICAGNLRSSCYEEISDNTVYTITVDHGSSTGENLICSYTDGKTTSHVHNYKLEAYNKDVFNSVTKDSKNVYVKLVNSDDFNKTTEINLSKLNVKNNAKLVVITADNEYAHVSNVNEKNNEVVVPVEKEITIANNQLVLDLPANSVSAIILELA